jgi:MFS family permease
VPPGDPTGSQYTRPLPRVLVVWLLVGGGGWAFTTAIGVYAFHRAGAGGVGAIVAARLLPTVVGAPLSGHTLDRVNRVLVIGAACAAQAVALTACGVLMLGGAGLPLLIGATVIFSLAASAPRPGLQALLPALARDQAELVRATAGWATVDNLAFVLGSGAGGLAIIVVVPAVVVLGAAGGLVVATATVLALPSTTPTELDDRADTDTPSVKAEVLGGVRALRATRSLWAPFALFAGLLLLEGTTDVQLVAVGLTRLNLGNGGPGVLFAVWGLGGMCSGAVLPRLIRRRGLGLVLAGGALTFGLALGFAGLPWPLAAVLAMVPTGLGFALVESGMMSVVPRLADDAVVGRVFALSEMLYGGAGAIGALVAPGLIALLGADASIAAVGLAFAVLAACTWPTLRRLDSDQSRAAVLRHQLLALPFFAPLSVPRVERLVQGARQRSLAAGHEIVRASEPGHEYFLIDQGVVEVVEPRLRLGAGQGFGEIALMRDLPRTATVRACSDVRLWVLSRAAFLGAVGSDESSARLVEALIVERLRRHDPAASPNAPDRVAEPAKLLI